MAAPASGKGMSIVGMIFVIALIIAAFQTCAVHCGADPCKIGASEYRPGHKQCKK